MRCALLLLLFFSPFSARLISSTEFSQRRKRFLVESAAPEDTEHTKEFTTRVLSVSGDQLRNLSANDEMACAEVPKRRRAELFKLD